MSEEIVARLMKKNSSNVKFLKESLLVEHKLLEADEDDEEKDENEEDTGDIEELNPNEDTEDEEGGELPPHAASRRAAYQSEEGSSSEEESEKKKEPLKIEKDDKKENVNPLDNPYAVNYKLGDRVALSYSNGTSTEVEATIDGYDKEGFYRIQLDSGMTINGMTDIALNDVVKDIKEEKCICGSRNFIKEDKYIVCDDCGRRIRESGLDQLTQLDKQRPKGKRMIRSIPHDMTTATRPNIADAAVGESIRKAFGKSLKEAEEPNPFQELIDSLGGSFWTRVPEIVRDIEELGYDVLQSNNEYISVITDDPEDDSEMLIPIGGTSRSMILDFDRARVYN